MATITSKGQVTIPKAVRQALDLAPGTKVDFVFQDGNVVLRRRLSTQALEKWRGSSPGPLPGGAQTVDELMALLRGPRLTDPGPEA